MKYVFENENRKPSQVNFSTIFFLWKESYSKTIFRKQHTENLFGNHIYLEFGELERGPPPWRSFPSNCRDTWPKLPATTPSMAGTASHHTPLTAQTTPSKHYQLLLLPPIASKLPNQKIKHHHCPSTLTQNYHWQCPNTTTNPLPSTCWPINYKLVNLFCQLVTIIQIHDCQCICPL